MQQSDVSLISYWCNISLLVYAVLTCFRDFSARARWPSYDISVI